MASWLPPHTTITAATTTAIISKRNVKRRWNRSSQRKIRRFFFSFLFASSRDIIMPQHTNINEWTEIKINGFYWCISCLSYLNAGVTVIPSVCSFIFLVYIFFPLFLVRLAVLISAVYFLFFFFFFCFFSSSSLRSPHFIYILSIPIHIIYWLLSSLSCSSFL